MTVKVRIPSALRAYAGGLATVEVPGAATVGEALDRITREHANLKPHLYDERGNLRQFVNVFLNGEDVRDLQKQETPVKAGDTVIIVPSVAGGHRS